MLEHYAQELKSLTRHRTESMIHTLAIVGATGAVGKIILDQLVSRKFPTKNIKLLASERSAGKTIECGGKQLVVEALTPEAFQDVQIAIGSTPEQRRNSSRGCNPGSAGRLRKQRFSLTQLQETSSLKLVQRRKGEARVKK